MQTQRGSRIRGGISRKFGAGEAARRNENRYVKVTRDEKRKEESEATKISKFEGTALDWFSFWKQFETEIDHRSPVTRY